MTITNTTVRQLYNGDGIVETFAIPFDYHDETEVQVWIRDTSVSPATETLQTAGVEYDLTGATPTTLPTTVDFGVAPTATDKVLVIRVSPSTQQVDLQSNTRIDVEAIEAQLDKLTVQVQELKEETDRSVKFGPTSDEVDIKYPDLVANQYVQVNSAGDGLESSDGVSSGMNAIVPAPADNKLIKTDGVDGQNMEETGITVDDTNGVTGMTSVAVDNITVDGNSITSTDTDGDINVTPDGTGRSNVTNPTLVGLSTGVAHSDASGNITSSNVVDADVDAAAAIARTKIADGTIDHVVINDGSGTLSSEAVLAITRGGTSGATATASFDALSPVTTKGDIIVRDATNNIRLAVGIDGQVLKADSAEASGLIWGASAAASSGGDVENLSLTYSSPTVTVAGADGSSLSGGNPGKIRMNSTTDGQVVTLELQANVTFDDRNGTSDITGQEFGALTGVAWDSDKPFYVYAVNEDDTDGGLEIAISPNPAAKFSPSTVNIAYKGNPASSPSDENFFFLTSTDVTVTHSGKPCKRIGGLVMNMNSSDDWSANIDPQEGAGIDSAPLVGRWFNMPDSQGGISGEFFNSADAPVWATPASIVYQYKLDLNGVCEFFFNTQGAGNCTNGTAGGTLQLHLPYVHPFTSPYLPPSNGVVTQAGTGVRRQIDIGPSGQLTTFRHPTTNGSAVMNGFSNVNDDILSHCRYTVFEVTI